MYGAEAPAFGVAGPLGGEEDEPPFLDEPLEQSGLQDEAPPPPYHSVVLQSTVVRRRMPRRLPPPAARLPPALAFAPLIAGRLSPRPSRSPARQDDKRVPGRMG